MKESRHTAQPPNQSTERPTLQTLPISTANHHLPQQHPRDHVEISQGILASSSSSLFPPDGMSQKSRWPLSLIPTFLRTRSFPGRATWITRQGATGKQDIILQIYGEYPTFQGRVLRFGITGRDWEIDYDIKDRSYMVYGVS
jgi:hypothetical protein